MTRDEILAMEPGRELDNCIARNILGWHVENNRCLIEGTLQSSEKLWMTTPRYSKEVSAAFEAVNKTRLYVRIEGHYHTGWEVTLGNECSATSWDLPVAMCRAALLAVMDV